MIVKEYFTTREDGVNLYRTFSDAGVCIKQVQTGRVYEEAIDIEDAMFTYEETDKLIERGEYGESDF